MMTKEERKNVNEELVALLLSFSEKQTVEILKAVTQDHFWDLPESEQVELLRRCIHVKCTPCQGHFNSEG